MGKRNVIEELDWIYASLLGTLRLMSMFCRAIPKKSVNAIYRAQHDRIGLSYLPISVNFSELHMMNLDSGDIIFEGIPKHLVLLLSHSVVMILLRLPT